MQFYLKLGRGISQGTELGFFVFSNVKSYFANSIHNDYCKFLLQYSPFIDIRVQNVNIIYVIKKVAIVT